MIRKKRKLLIIGLDGVPLEMLTSLARDSVMPNVSRILKCGKLAKMSVTIPEISSVSWSSFMTGTDSGNHGIFGFVDLVPGGYQYRFPDFRDLTGATFFDRMAKHNKRSVIINLPATYPARDINGVLISGFVALDLRKAIRPARYYPLLDKMGYQVDVEAAKGKNKKVEFISDLFYTLRVRKQVADFLFKNEKWDLFMLTITGTDRIHHFLYDAFLNKDHEFHQQFLNYYREVDNVIGDFYQKIAGKDEFELIMLSDHGFGPIEQEVYLNPVLQKFGFFQFEKSQSKELSAITHDSKAFAIDPSRIFIHGSDRFKKGAVASADYKKIRKDLKQLFTEFEINGKKVINRAFYKEELYSSRFLDRAPDLVLLANPGFDLKAGFKKNDLYGRSHFSGMHLWDNAFFFSTKSELIPKKMTIFKVADLILKILAVN